MVSHSYAMGVAVEFCLEIGAYCFTEPEIVGSLRRKKSEVGDIDILVIPKIENTPDDTLFGTITPINVLDRKLAGLCIENRMRLDVNGEKIKRFYNFDDSEISIDIYVATPQTLPTLRLIRTGSKEHNIKLCMRAQSMRMQLKANGEGLYDSQLKRLAINCEEDIFRFLELEYLPPEKRE